MSRKDLLTYEDLIKKMQAMGIRFNIVNTDEAINVMRNHNYFFKLGSFRKNYEKNDKDNRYNIEFAFLSDLATLDMRIRYIFLHMCLDIEHSIKCRILDDITYHTNEDGYEIMLDFFKTEYGDKDRVFSNVMFEKEGVKSFKKGFEKYYDDPPIWVCLELMSYGSLSAFVDFYYARREANVEFKKANQYIRLVKNIRNKCAHSEPVISKLYPNYGMTIPQSLYAKGRAINITVKQMKIKTIMDMLALFELHKAYCSEGIINSRKVSLQEFLERSKRNLKYYDKSTSVSIFFNALRKMVANHNRL
ncbi:CAAX protease [Sporosarcina sp. P16b]|uniref:Abi family protein n=1 Tax=Sporosarcina sp. P16b TaxID=2048261 RepID=UPI000C16E075|nr:Abi family protein [Sporosarcina sp. P16b]PIC71128.1 CAAX protease [Sporosarcina sp. P16b]